MSENEDRGSPEEKADCAAVKAAISKTGFADYFFIGISMSGRRFTSFSIGNDGHEHAFQNCERWDRLVGAINRQTMRWEIENSGFDLDVNPPEVNP